MKPLPCKININLATFIEDFLKFLIINYYNNYHLLSGQVRLPLEIEHYSIIMSNYVILNLKHKIK